MKIQVIKSLTKEQIQALHTLYQSEWWTRERELSGVQRVVENSDVIVGLCDIKTNELIGFARVLTDYVYKALILDVMVKESYRGKGLGRVLIDTVVQNPSLKDVEHFELYCRPEMIPFYEKWGFTKELGEIHFVRKIRKS